MKLTWQDIIRILKPLLLLAVMAVLLSACSTDSDSMTGAESGSGTGEELDEQQRACWQGSLLAMFYNAMGQASMQAWPLVTGGALPLIMVGFAIWLSFRVLKHISSVSEESPAEVWTEVGKMAATCLFCGLLASSTEFLVFTLNTFIFPIYYTFLEYSARILELAAPEAQSKGQMLNDTCMIYTNEKLICAAPPLEKIESASSASFPSGPSTMMQCLVCTTSDRMQMGFIIAKNLLALPSLASFLAGIMIYVIFAIVKVSFVFYLVDSIFRMTLMIIILPLLILAIPFKYTRKWSHESFKTILNSSAIMMCLAVMMTMAMLAMQVVIQQNSEELGDKGKYQEFSIIMIAMIMMGFLVLKSCGLAVAMADSLVGGGGGTDFQKKIAKLAAWTAKKLAVAVSAGTGKVFTSVLDRFEKLRDIKEKAQKARKVMQKLAGRDRE